VLIWHYNLPLFFIRLTQWMIMKVAPLAHIRDLGMFLHNHCLLLLYFPSDPFSISIILV